MHIVVPMAGLGQRFREAGYALPKPLIPVSGVPMVVCAVRDLPASERVTFLVHPDHVRESAIDRRLLEHFPQATIIATPGLTAGQACTVRLSSAAVSPDEEVLVAACDNTHVYDADQFDTLRRDPSIDAIIWTYRHDPRVLVQPTAHGWVSVGQVFNLPGQDAILPHVARVSCKQPISQTPLADHAISGCFWFRRAGELYQAIDELVASDQRVNTEFYLDQVPNVLIERGRRVAVFQVEKYIGWGTPHDLEDYESWERYFTRRPSVPLGREWASGDACPTKAA